MKAIKKWRRKKKKVDQNFLVFDHEENLWQLGAELGEKKAFEDNRIPKQKDR